MRILLVPGSYTSPSARFRVWQFVEPLRELGHHVDVRVTKPDRLWAGPQNGTALRRVRSRIGTAARIVSALRIAAAARLYDVVLMNRDLVPEPNETFVERFLLRQNSRVVFDFDDAIHLGARESKLRALLPLFAWVTAGNEYLASFARQLTGSVSVWPTVVDTAYYQPPHSRRPGPVRVGWSGSASTVKHCLPLLEQPICRLAAAHDIEFVVIAGDDPGIRWAGVQTRFIRWTPATEVAGVQEIDIGLMPLRDEPFERGKCGLKAIQYMGVGVPALVSPVGANAGIVLDGVTGYHCSTDDDWERRTSLLIRDQALRRRLGESARERVVRHYSVASLLPRMDRCFLRVGGRLGDAEAT